MSDVPFLGEVIAWPVLFAPRGWALCYGQLLPISQHQALFSLLGARFGGNGQTTFALPDLRGRSILGSTAGAVGAHGGSVTIPLTAVNIAPDGGPMAAQLVTTPVGNRSEYIVLNYIISLQGVYPSRN